jgi:hypothetical protein
MMPLMERFTTPMALLQSAREVHGFDILVLTDADGFTLAYAHGDVTEPTVPGEMECDVVAATSALAWRMVQRMQELAGLQGIEEATFSNRAGRRMICRLFEAGGQTMILVALLPTYTSYRRVTTTLVHDLKRVFETPLIPSDVS